MHDYIALYRIPRSNIPSRVTLIPTNPSIPTYASHQITRRQRQKTHTTNGKVHILDRVKLLREINSAERSLCVNTRCLHTNNIYRRHVDCRFVSLGIVAVANDKSTSRGWMEKGETARAAFMFLYALRLIHPSFGRCESIYYAAGC